MIVIGITDFIAAIVVLLAGAVAVRPGLLSATWSRLAGQPDPASPPSQAGEPVSHADRDAVLRMFAVMVMAFAFTLAAFFTLIFLFSRNAPLA